MASLLRTPCLLALLGIDCSTLPTQLRAWVSKVKRLILGYEVWKVNVD
jgi:hypothetical protein